MDPQQLRINHVVCFQSHVDTCPGGDGKHSGRVPKKQRFGVKKEKKRQPRRSDQTRRSDTSVSSVNSSGSPSGGNQYCTRRRQDQTRPDIQSAWLEKAVALVRELLMCVWRLFWSDFSCFQPHCEALEFQILVRPRVFLYGVCMSPTVNWRL